MTDTQREAFEAYFLDSRKSKHKPNFARLEDGTYADDHTQRHWWTWQQAALTQPQAQQAKACHDSDCSVNNAPALPVGPCDCGFEAQQAAAVPAGFKLVPIEPTHEMLDRGHHQIDFDREGQNTSELVDASHFDENGVGTSIETDMRDAWAAMLAAAPPPPVLPLSDERIDKIREALVEKMLATGMLVGDDAWDHSLARAIERAHGITEPGAGVESGA